MLGHLQAAIVSTVHLPGKGDVGLRDVPGRLAAGFGEGRKLEPDGTCWFSGSSTGAQSLFKGSEMLSVDSQRGVRQPSQVSGGCQQQTRFWAIGSSLSSRLEASWAGGVCPAEGPEGPGLPCPCDCRQFFIVNTAASDPRRAVGRGKARRRRCLIGLHPSVAILPRIVREGAPDAAGPPCCPLPCALPFIVAPADCAVGPRHPVGR